MALATVMVHKFGCNISGMILVRKEMWMNKGKFFYELAHSMRNIFRKTTTELSLHKLLPMQNNNSNTSE